MNKILLFSILTGLIYWSACTPKVTEQTQTTVTEQPVVKPKPAATNLSPCPKFSDFPNQDEIETNYVLYRDFMKAQDWNQAFDYWKKVYSVAPAADGQRNTVYADGIRFYEHFISLAGNDASKRDVYIQEIFKIYDEIEKCYKEGGYVNGRKAFDYYYKYTDLASKEEVYRLFKSSMDEDGDNAQYFILNPFTAVLVSLHEEGKVSDAEAKQYQQKIRARLAKGLKECKGKDCEQWKIIEGYVPARLEAFETVKGFYDCTYYLNKYFPDFQENPEDCDVIRTVFSRFKWGDCPETDARFAELLKVANEKCVEKAEPGLVTQGYDALRNAKYQQAIGLFEQAVAETADKERKSQILLVMSKVYHAHLKNFSKSRQYALQAAETRPGWGEPYIQIGRLYASSGPLCGPGTGWDSQVVVWPAIDMWNRAKSIDPSSAAEANKWINRYAQFMPSMEDIFQRGLKVGDSYTVPCWIQAGSSIRPAPKQ